MKNNSLTIMSYEEEGLSSLFDSAGWTVIILNYLPRLAEDKIADMQRHEKTDECFILAKGKAILFTSEGKDAPEAIEAQTGNRESLYCSKYALAYASHVF